ncbi:MAG: acetolactate decarboxylase [Planctomycetota bacterium]
MNRAPMLVALLAVLLLASCTAPPATGPVRTFGGLRDVMRNGNDEGRVVLTDVATPTAVGVGALAGLRGEVTIADGRALVAERVGDDVAMRDARPGERATLLVACEVAAWTELPLPDCADYATLEQRIGEALRQRGVDPFAPTPVRVTGRARNLRMHVIAGACPIANPTGPSPWRYDGPADDLTLVGFYVEDAAGQLTHHNRQSHLHAIADARTGHLDEVALEQVRLFVPAK